MEGGWRAVQRSFQKRNVLKRGPDTPLEKTWPPLLWVNTPWMHGVKAEHLITGPVKPFITGQSDAELHALTDTSE